MNHTGIIVKKEIREMITPGSVASILIMVVLFAGMGGLIGGEVEKSVSLPYFGIVSEDGYEFDCDVGNGTVEHISWDPVGFLESVYGDESYRITVMDAATDGSPQDIVAEMEEKGLGNAIVMPSREAFGAAMESQTPAAVLQYYIYQPTGMFGGISSSVMGSIVSYLNADLSSRIVEAGGLTDYTFAMSPLSSSGESISTIVNGEAYKDVTPDEISNAVSSQTMMIPLVIMIIITMIGSIVISSMGNEKENKTLETLLTLPIKRTSIVGGKILAAAVVGLIYGLAYMAGMSIYMNAMTGIYAGSASIDLADVGMALDPGDWALVMASMFLAIVCALGICMILGAFSKNYKSAQTMTMPLSILAMIPMFVIMFTGWYGCGSALQAVCFAIPFSHPMMAMQALMNGDVALVLEGIAYMAAFAVATILVTVRMYNSDILITGLGQSRLVQKLTERRRGGIYRWALVPACCPASHRSCRPTARRPSSSTATPTWTRLARPMPYRDASLGAPCSPPGAWTASPRWRPPRPRPPCATVWGRDSTRSWSWIPPRRASSRTARGSARTSSSTTTAPPADGTMRGCSTATRRAVHAAR